MIVLAQWTIVPTISVLVTHRRERDEDGCGPDVEPLIPGGQRPDAALGQRVLRAEAVALAGASSMRSSHSGGGNTILSSPTAVPSA